MAEDVAIAETTGYVVSTDGSKIGYRKMGKGPALVILHGALISSQYYKELVRSLSNTFTVYITDRRGRGLSITDVPEYSIEKEKEDLKALIKENKAEYVFGHSAGAVIALEASFDMPIKKLALYEPPVLVDGRMPFPTKWLPEFNRAIAQGRKVKGLSIFIKNLKMTPVSQLPNWLFMGILRLSLIGKNKEDTFSALPTIEREIDMLQNLDPDVERYQSNTTTTLLLTGERSPVYFRNAVRVLLKNMPLVNITILPDHDHASPTFTNIAELSNEIKRFLLEPALDVKILA